MQPNQKRRVPHRSIPFPSFDPSRLALVAGLLAGAGLIYEVALTRIFSLLFQYHFVFLVVSISVSGLGVGAALAYLSLKNGQIRHYERMLQQASLGLIVIFPVAALGLTLINASSLLLLSILIALLPFGLIGWISALLYTSRAEYSGVIYSGDLVGGALGLVASPFLMMLMGPYNTILLLGAVAAVTSMAIHKDRRLALAVIGCILITVVNVKLAWLNYDARRIVEAPPDKTMVQLLQQPDTKKVASQWGPFAQVDLVQINDPEAMVAFTDAGAGSIMQRYAPNAAAQDFRWLNAETAYLPFQTGPIDRTLIIGAGVGFDVFMAYHAGAKTISAVEINPTLVTIARQYADFNGNILDLPGVTTTVMDGRNFVERSMDRYDLIYLNVVYSQAAAPGTTSLVENNVFTREAFAAYWQHLADHGRLSIVTHNGMEGVRLLMTALEMLEQSGMPLTEAISHTALVMSPNEQDPNAAPAVFVLQREPFTPTSAREFNQAARDHRLTQPLFVPFTNEDALKMLRNGSTTLAAYLANNTDYNIFPTTDDRPFFYHIEAGLPQPLTTLLFLTSLAVIVLLAVAHLSSPPRQSRALPLAGYFALLGVGFMLVEVNWIQRLRLILGDPVLALIVVLGTLFASGAVGSIVSRALSKRFTKPGQIVMLACLGIAAWLSVLSFIPASVFFRAAAPVQLLAAVLALCPLGFCLGIPFPTGLRMVGLGQPDAIPLLWGVNAISTMFGAALAMVTALLWGYQVVLWLSIGVYLAAGLIVRLMWKVPTQ